MKISRARIRRCHRPCVSYSCVSENNDPLTFTVHVKPQLIKRLKDEGFLILASSQGKSSSKRARPKKFIVNHDPVVVSARDRDYFNPLVWIDHHVCELSVYSIIGHVVSTIIDFVQQYELRQSNVSPNSQIPQEMSASTQATDGRQTEHGDKEEEAGDTENETDELVEVMPSSSAPKSSHWKNISGARTVPLPMGPPKRPLPSDHTFRRKRLKE